MAEATQEKQSFVDKLMPFIYTIAGPLTKFGQIPFVKAVTNGMAGTIGITMIGSLALVVFLLVKSFNKMKDASSKIGKKDSGDDEPAMNPPACPFCLEEVKEGATRCPHCAGAFDKPAEPTPAE